MNYLLPFFVFTLLAKKWIDDFRNIKFDSNGNRKLKKYEYTDYKLPDNRIGRNEMCHCDSGKKYKKCCMNNLYYEIKKSREESENG